MDAQDMEEPPKQTASMEMKASITGDSGEESLQKNEYSNTDIKHGDTIVSEISQGDSIIDTHEKQGYDLVTSFKTELKADSIAKDGRDGKSVCNDASAAIAHEDSVAQDLQEQEDELRGLGINVVDQVSFERNVEAAVEKAVTMQVRKQRLQMLKKEEKDVQREIKQAEIKIEGLTNRLTGMRQRVVDPRMYFKVEEEVKNKSQQLKALKTRESFLHQKLVSAEINQEELDDFDLEEGEIPDEENQGVEGMLDSEREKLIREGQMTPFGTISTASKTVSFPRPSLTNVKKESSVRRPTKAEMISSGEMTPFGTIMRMTDHSAKKSEGKSFKQSEGVGEFEKYLQDQINRQKQHSESAKDSQPKKSLGDPTYGVQKKKKKKLKEYIGVYDYGESEYENGSYDNNTLSLLGEKAKSRSKAGKKTRRKEPLKKHILQPKKKKVEKVHGTVISTLEDDQLKRPLRKLLSERLSFEESDFEVSDHQDSGSEYVPSGHESSDFMEYENDDDNRGENIRSEKRKIDSDHDSKKRTSKKKKMDKNSDDWMSEDDSPKIKSKRVSKEKDDGDLNRYIRRIELWKKERLKTKQKKILRGDDFDSEEEEEEGYEQFTGGYKVPLIIWNKLYKYQRTCVRWLWELHSQGCGGILGDEMGLGKTIQIISFLVGLSFSGLTYRRQRWEGLGPVLVVCPATVLHQWVKEFHKWWPPFRVAVLHESGSFTGKRPALIHNINSNFGILVTSYTGVRDQLEVLLQYDWHYIILDEGHKIRNPDAQITVAMKRFTTPHRLILSGSPIQNSLKELWSLFDFVFPGKLGTLPVFLQQFAVPITQGGYANATKLEVQTAFKCASMLRDTINPYLLRRMKNDVRSHLNLPEKNEQVLFCGLSEEQRKIYQEYISGDQVKAIMGGRAKIFVGLINLRKICNHPDLYTGGPRGIDSSWDSGLQPELKYGWWSRSGKMHVLHSVLKLWSDQGHRVLLFTQSRQMMCILEKFLMDEHYSYLKMDGVTTVSSRQPLIDKFNSDPSYFVFLLTTRVGGLGVNLTGADRVVIYDPDWNPSTDSQARERAWRIGQMRHVTIYRFLTAGTIEEKIYHRQIFKQFLTNRVLKDPKQQRFFKTNDLYELFTLTEGEKDKTESSAIFAGTGSEIKLGAQKGECDEEETFSTKEKSDSCETIQQRTEQKNIHFSDRAGTGKSLREERKRDKNQNKCSEKMDEVSPSISTSQMEKMKDLAKRLSQKIGNSKKSLDEKPDTSQSKDTCGESEGKVIAEDSKNVFVNDIPKVEVEVGVEENTNDINEDSTNCIKEEVDGDIKKENTDDSKEDVENLSNFASGESTTVGKSLTVLDKEGDSKIQHVGGDKVLNQIVGGDGGDEERSKCNESTSHKASSVGRDVKSDEENEEKSDVEKKSVSQSDLVRKSADEEKPPKELIKHKSKYKKKDKDRNRERHSSKLKKRGKKFEGTRIEYLVKKKAYQKTQEEEAEERQRSKSQDQYILEKLFRKSGVHTALSHDVIMNNSDPDYLLVEGEAERVAKEALKAVRASRSKCFRPPRDEMRSAGKGTPKFGKKKSQIFIDVNSPRGSDAKEGQKKKTHMFDGGIEEEEEEEDENEDVEKKIVESKTAAQNNGQSKTGESSGMLSSSQLLSRMQQRNRGMALDSEEEDDEDGYNPDYPSTATMEAESCLDPEVQENIDLLADIRNFVAFQAEVDGQATTQEIISRFQQRLPPGQTPFFKALLTQICDFHRDNAGKGIWSLKGEFR